MPDYDFKIISHIATLSTSGRGWTKELNLVSWNGMPAKYDLRDWGPNYNRVGKGTTLTEDEYQVLKDVLIPAEKKNTFFQIIQLLQLAEKCGGITPEEIVRILDVEKDEVDYFLGHYEDDILPDDHGRWSFINTDFKISKSGVYYLFDYIPTRKWSWMDEKDLMFSRIILQYKNGERDAMESNTLELCVEIDRLTFQKVKTKNVILVAVPPSKVNAYSPVRESIKRICDMEKGMAVFNFIDCGDMLTRRYDIRSSHQTNIRPSYDEQKASIICSRPDLCGEDCCCILMDDVTTTGTIMNVCKDILVERGMPERNIIKLAIAQTV